MKKLFFIAAAVSFISFFSIGLVLAAPLKTGLGGALSNLEGSVGTAKTGLPSDLSTTVATVVRAALALVGTVFLLLTIYAGILWMTASGKEEQIETAQKIIKATVIGLFITLSAYAITSFVAGRLSGVGGAAGGGGGTAAPAGAPAGGAGAGKLTDPQCEAKGARCDYVDHVGTGCDPKGIDIYDGTSAGDCTPDNGVPRICCVLKDTQEKCEKLGGNCAQVDNCSDLKQVNVGIKCEEFTPDKLCCKVP